MSTEYTPTTESVRRLFLMGAQHEDAPAGFDRWLAKRDAEVKAEALSLDQLDTLVEHLLSDGTRGGLELANAVNEMFGRSARRRVTTDHQDALHVSVSARPEDSPPVSPKQTDTTEEQA